MAVTREEPATPPGRVRDRLAERHRDVEEELVVPGDEGEDGGERLPILDRAREGGGELAKQEAGAGDVALVHLVARREPRATIPLRGTPPPLRRAPPRAGPRTSAIQRSRARTSASLPPNRITLPSPSLRVQ